MPFGHQIGPGDFMGGLPGIAVFDYDGDEDLDIYITNGEGFPNRLLQNDGQANFIDVASISGVDDRGRGHGVATADIDNDGDLDLYVANDGPNKLYLNNGNGKFTDIAPSAGVVSKSNSTACAFADIDNDGYVDLYLGAADQFSGYGSNILYRNKGDLSFTDITDQTGTHGGYSWAVGFCDYDNDGDQDIFTANDQGLARKEESCQIMLYRNDINLVSGGGATWLRFTEVTEQAGFDKTGSWMGLAFGDYDLDGDFDLFATNLGTSFQFEAQDTDYHSLYRNNGDGTFTDVAEALSLAQWEFGWGTVFTDFDNDGDQDVYVPRKNDKNWLFVNQTLTSSGSDIIYNENPTPLFVESSVAYGISDENNTNEGSTGYGAAWADYDNDDDFDLYLTNWGKNRLYQNNNNIFINIAED
ncbi:MAG: VCBS repeat-containing protein, partial [Candidatus Poribacteria bacterium]|nr:VCBS repeat-containing protein [Candidatus Poribacteria bacterium]